METFPIHVFGAMYDIISLKYDIVDDSNYIDERLVHEWSVWRVWMENADVILRKTDWRYDSIRYPDLYIEPQHLVEPYEMDFPGEFVIQGGDIDEEAS